MRDIAQAKPELAALKAEVERCAALVKQSPLHPLVPAAYAGLMSMLCDAQGKYISALETVVTRPDGAGEDGREDGGG